MTDNERRALYLLIITATVILTAGLGLRDPWPADEPRFALIARDMVESGNWFLPRVGGVLYPDKPPLHFWFVAALYHLTGSLRFSFLIPAFLSGIATLLLVVDLGRRVWSHAAGIWSGAVLLSLIQFPLQMKSGQLDGPLCFWTTLALYGFCRHLLLGPDWRWYAIGGLAAGFGIITKGVGFLPYLVFIPYIVVAYRGWQLPTVAGWNWRWAIAPLLTLFAVGVWLVPMLIITSDATDPGLVDYRNNILFHQTVTRYADSWGHLKPPWYLFTNAVPWLWLPATLLLPWLIPAWWRDAIRHHTVPLLLLGGWVMLVLLFFSMSAGKRSVYIFPAAPAFALVVGYYMPRLAIRASPRKTLAAFPVVLGVLLGVVGMYGLMNPHELQDYLPQVSTIVKMMLVLLATGIAITAIGLLSAWRRSLVGVAASLAVFWLVLSLLVSPGINNARSGEALVLAAAAKLESEQDLGMVGWPEQFLLYVDRPITHFGYRRNRQAEFADGVAWLIGDASRRLLVDDSTANDCVDDDASAVSVGRAHRRDWLLLRADDLDPACRLSAASGPDRHRVYVYERPGRRGATRAP